MGEEVFETQLLCASHGNAEDVRMVSHLGIRAVGNGGCRLILSNPSRLLREGLARMLHSKGFSVVASGDTIAAALEGASCSGTEQILICGWRDTEKAGEILLQIRQAKALDPGLRVVILSDSLDSRLLCQAADCDVDAVLSMNISEDVLRGALNLVLLGQRLFPAPTTRAAERGLMAQPDATVASAKDSSPHASTSVAHIPVLSEREDQILRFLGSGKRNKLIAHDLGISEATVKFHIRALMRKLGVANRTQAAIFGMNRGKVGEENDDAELAAQRSNVPLLTPVVCQ